MAKWYNIVNKSDRAEIWIYEQIGEDFWTGGGVTAKSFQKELSAIKASQIDLHINSPGGVVFDGITIYNLIKQHPANVTTYIDGLAASIASVIALAGDRVIMAENALYMIHNPSGGSFGTANEMRAFADVLEKVGWTMLTAYEAKCKKPKSEIQTMLDAETWMTAAEAMEAGFIDEIGSEMDMAACVKFAPAMAKMGFKHVPENILAVKEPPTARSLEQALRDAGCSSKLAKTILAKGLTADLRDEEPAEADPQPAKSVARDAEQNQPGKSIDRMAKLLAKAELIVPSST